jgi:hypothetical protein
MGGLFGAPAAPAGGGLFGAPAAPAAAAVPPVPSEPPLRLTARFENLPQQTQEWLTATERTINEWARVAERFPAINFDIVASERAADELSAEANIIGARFNMRRGRVGDGERKGERGRWRRRGLGVSTPRMSCRRKRILSVRVST